MKFSIHLNCFRNAFRADTFPEGKKKSFLTEFPLLKVHQFLLAVGNRQSYHCKVAMSRVFFFFFWNDAHFFERSIHLRKLTFLRLYPTNFHKTKCIDICEYEHFS